MKDKLKKFQKMLWLLNWKKANIQVRLDALKIYGIPNLFYGGFLFNDGLCSKSM